MSYEHAFDALMPQTILLSTSGPARDAYGVATWSGAGVSHKARVVQRRQYFRSNNGDSLVAEALAYIATTAQLSTALMVTTSSGSVYPILAVAQFPDEDGSNHHVKAWLGRRYHSGSFRRF